VHIFERRHRLSASSVQPAGTNLPSACLLWCTGNRGIVLAASDKAAGADDGVRHGLVRSGDDIANRADALLPAVERRLAGRLVFGAAAEDECAASGCLRVPTYFPY
jgi:hypothetical protein